MNANAPKPKPAELGTGLIRVLWTFANDVSNLYPQGIKKSIQTSNLDKIMDEIDKQIIGLLSVDARMTTTEIAGKVYRSRVAVQNRIESLIKRGEILGFGVSLRRKAVPAIFEICLKPKSKCEDIIPKFRAKFNITKAWSVTGSKDLFIWAEVDEAQDLQIMRTFISDQQEVFSVSTHIVIKTYE